MGVLVEKGLRDVRLKLRHFQRFLALGALSNLLHAAYQITISQLSRHA